MAVIENKEGVGALAGIAWTPLNGTDLSPSELAQVDGDVDAATSMAEALLEAANGAFNLGWQAFSLADLAEGAALGERGLLERTQLQSTSPSDSASDWALFLASVLPNGPDMEESMSLAAWRRLADDLQGYAALQASRRALTENTRAAVTHSNGQWFVNGQSLSLLDLFTAVRVNRVVNLEEQQLMIIDDIKANSSLLSAAQEWLAMIRSLSPTGDAKASIPSGNRDAFVSKWGFDPVIFLDPLSPALEFNVPTRVFDFDRWINDIKAYVDLKDSDNQTLQLELTRKGDRQAEAIDEMVSFANKTSQTGNRMAGNLG